MSMVPFFPSLKPPIANCLWFEVDSPCNEEAEVLALEREQHSWLNSITGIASDLNPMGKVLTIAGPETDDEDANDDSDDSESHDDEDEEEIDRLLAVADRVVNMETAYSPAEAHTPNNEDRTPQNQ